MSLLGMSQTLHPLIIKGYQLENVPFIDDVPSKISKKSSGVSSWNSSHETMTPQATLFLSSQTSFFFDVYRFGTGSKFKTPQKTRVFSLFLVTKPSISIQDS
jgi:hypothetical protein